ncbi:hypothetical protein GCM10022261_00370 [Brevibacterium daeguense]|uniref:Uncharacterized protein n=1 Tax=Brevibacterium daeguense TaxID=909936 RepID=A0ABP8EEW8_9MICO
MTIAVTLRARSSFKTLAGSPAKQPAAPTARAQAEAWSSRLAAIVTAQPLRLRAAAIARAIRPDP